MEVDYSKVYRLKGKVQHYAWGGSDYLPHLLGFSNTEGTPCAEYWMGAHDKAPAQVATDGEEWHSVNQVIGANPEKALGTEVFHAFHRLPYLFKILDVKDMLSIQVHPDKQHAVEEFRRENQEGIPLDDPRRNYKDDNHKPELMIALGDFWLLHGFKTENELAATMEEYPEFAGLLKTFMEHGYEALYQEVMTMDQEQVNATLQPILDRIVPLYRRGELPKSEEDFWAARAKLIFNQEGKIDRGIFSIYFFNLLHLKTGEAIFQDAGVPHAYLEGQNVEIMANSDNVLRGGLTVKHIDVPELLKHVKCRATQPAILKGTNTETGGRVYKTPAPDFEISQIDLKKGERAHFRANTTEIIFALRGAASVATTNLLELASGEAAVVFAQWEVEIRSEEGATLFRASVPVD